MLSYDAPAMKECTGSKAPLLGGSLRRFVRKKTCFVGIGSRGGGGSAVRARGTGLLTLFHLQTYFLRLCSPCWGCRRSCFLGAAWVKRDTRDSTAVPGPHPPRRQFQFPL